MLYLPQWMAKWKREGYRYYKQDTELFKGLMDDVKIGLVGCLFVICLFIVFTNIL